MYAKSELRKTGEVGEVLLEALGGGGAGWARRKRAEAGVAPDPELEHVGKAAGDQYRCRHGIVHCHECRLRGLFGVSHRPALQLQPTWRCPAVGSASTSVIVDQHSAGKVKGGSRSGTIACRLYQDGSYAAAEREVFDQQLAAFYESHSAVQVSCATPPVGHTCCLSWCPVMPDGLMAERGSACHGAVYASSHPMF